MTAGTAVSPLEKILAVSLAILKSASNPKKSLEQKGGRVQLLNRRRLSLLEIPQDDNPGDEVRRAMIRYVGKLAEQKIRGQL